LVIEQDEDCLDREGDPVRTAAGPLLVCILELTADGSRERARAVSEMLEAVERIKAALAAKPTLN
jgi:hypothetical protein